MNALKYMSWEVKRNKPELKYKSIFVSGKLKRKNENGNNKPALNIILITASKNIFKKIVIKKKKKNQRKSM